MTLAERPNGRSKQLYWSTKRYEREKSIVVTTNITRPGRIPSSRSAPERFRG